MFPSSTEDGLNPVVTLVPKSWTVVIKHDTFSLRNRGKSLFDWVIIPDSRYLAGFALMSDLAIRL